MGTQLDTGTGAARRRLTLEEAQRGDAPTPYTCAEWDAMHRATGTLPGPTQWAGILSTLIGRALR